MSNKAPQRSRVFEKKDNERWDRQEAFNKWIKKEISDIKNTPTMKKELG